MELYLYAHTGSKNHGCEAIVRSTLQINSKYKFSLFSQEADEEFLYKINVICSNVKLQGEHLVPRSFRHVLLKFRSLIEGNKKCYTKFRYRYLLKNLKPNDLYFSIGGDMYCYKGSLYDNEYLNRSINACCSKTVLWGCSIEPDLLKNPRMVEDLKKYMLITPRESITYNALLDAGVNKNTKLYPDPAFTLKTIKLELPEGFVENNTIGINVSPLIMNYESYKGSTMNNYVALINHIIESTNMQVALIPHVVCDFNDDRIPLYELYNKFSSTGRVVMIDDYNCMELKGYIARCRMFIGARTHATIAAYSSCVPTLVVGYSIKAKGIAKDIFGTYDNYVIPVQTLINKEDLINAFEWMKINEANIKKCLEKFMPNYIDKAWQAGNEIDKLINE